MPTSDDIRQQRELLATHRQTLAHYLKQQAIHSSACVPPATAHGIREARAEIARIKGVLRGWGVAVKDMPDDGDGADELRMSNLKQETGECRESNRPSSRIFISYKRHTDPDESLALLLRSELERAGHEVFIDQQMVVGTEWMAELADQIAASNFMIVLLSQHSVNSEMVAQEVAWAHENCQRSGTSCLLPVRVAYTERLPYQLRSYLDPLHYAEWTSHDDTPLLVQRLLDAVAHCRPLPQHGPSGSGDADTPSPPLPAADPTFIRSLCEPGVAVRLHECYIKRDGDTILEQELDKPHGTTITIRSARQTGKSSLLIRGIGYARKYARQIVFFDFRQFDEICRNSLDDFLRCFATEIVYELELGTDALDHAWKGSRTPVKKMTSFMEKHVLPHCESRLLLAMDEADRLLHTSFYNDFFAMIGAWQDLRAKNDVWEKLDIVMVISTEPHILVNDIHQSPFDSCTKIRLYDFDTTQVQALNTWYRTPLATHELPSLMELLHGHPFLTRKALYTLVTEQVSWAELAQKATDEQCSPFRDHLHTYLWLLYDKPDLKAGLKHIIEQSSCPDEVVYDRLVQAGLIRGTQKTCQCRCRLYEEYFRYRV